MTLTSKANSKISSEVRGWYEFSREIIPSIERRSFASFIGGSSALSLQVTKDAANYSFIIDTKSETAYIDAEHKVIALPLWYIHEETLTKMFGEGNDLEAVALSLCNGSHIHEALHAKLTDPKLITDFYSALEKDQRDFMMANQQVANVIMNAAEDLFIETDGRMTLSTFVADMLQTKNSLLFDENDVKKMVEEAGTDKASVAHLQVQLFTALKNLSLRKFIVSTDAITFNSTLSAAIKRYLDVLADHAKKNTFVRVGARAYSAYEVTRAIVNSLSEKQREELNQKMAGTGSGMKGEGAKAGGKGEKFELSTEKTPSGEGIEMEISAEEAETMAAEFEAAASMVMKAAKIKNANESKWDKSEGTSVPAVTYYDDIFSIPTDSSAGRLDTSHFDYHFVNVLRQLRTTNHANGPIRKSGNHLVNQRLYRIASDGKMFANKEFERLEAHKVAVVILIDASGSMGTNYKKVLSEAFGMFKALREASIPTAVYAHTSCLTNSATPGLYRIIDSGIDKNETQVEDRFTAALNIPLSENYDGVIIDSLLKRVFARLPESTKKLLFVLSDGSPSGANYMGRSAIEHTVGRIAKARHDGIFVSALSLVAGVVLRNNEIYGKEYNVDAAANLRQSFENLVIRMQEEGRL